MWKQISASKKFDPSICKHLSKRVVESPGVEPMPGGCLSKTDRRDDKLLRHIIKLGDKLSVRRPSSYF